MAHIKRTAGGIFAVTFTAPAPPTSRSFVPDATPRTGRRHTDRGRSGSGAAPRYASNVSLSSQPHSSLALANDPAHPPGAPWRPGEADTWFITRSATVTDSASTDAIIERAIWAEVEWSIVVEPGVMALV